MERERKSLDMFSIVVVALAAIAVAIVVLAITMPDLTLRMFAADAKDFQASAEERIRPLSQYYSRKCV